MLTCTISHNMIVEDERYDYYDGDSDDNEPNPELGQKIIMAQIYLAIQGLAKSQWKNTCIVIG